jgi:hypothetical protein
MMNLTHFALFILAVVVVAWGLTVLTGWIDKRLFPTATEAGPHRNRAQLKRWIAEHMPELDRELGPMGMNQVRKRLNEVTGCNVQGGDSIEASSAVFLAALKRMHEAKESA